MTPNVVFTLAWLLITLVSLVASMAFGAANISMQDVVQSIWGLVFELGSSDLEPLVGEVKQRIILELRAPRAVLAFLTGAGLSLAGAVLQTVTRNPLSDPYLFGISSGASFGAVLVIASITGTSLGAASAFSEFTITVGALLGSLLSVVLVVALAGRSGSIERMLLAGVACSFMFSAATSLVLYMSDPLAASSLIFWTLGSFSRAEWSSLTGVIVVVGVGLLVFISFSRPLRAMLAGDESARALGVSVVKLRLGMLLLSSLMTAVLVANCGGIGFVGLMIPHIVRRLIQGRTINVYIATALLGGVFMVWVDVLARTLHGDFELPVGIITAAIGSTFFLLVLYRRETHAS
ncbi:iron ABC transporter permease [Oleiphilus sp. HI0080]|jgi:iron complex transport system permease protein|nr:iron ABC transporter permease [Oleiphilus sp. HI0080]